MTAFVGNRQIVFVFLLGIVLLAEQSSGAESYEKLVKEIVESPQSFDGEIISKLVDLGPDAVPAIGAALTQGVTFPATLVRALGRIGSEEGMDPLLRFLQTRTPYYERDSLSIMTILALKGVENHRACQPLAVILDDTTVDPSIRLAAARTISSLCSAADAQDFVLEAHQVLKVRQPGESAEYIDDEVLLGLIDVNNDKSEAILVELLHSEGNTRIYVPVIEHLAARGGESVTKILHEVIERKDIHEYPIRVAAVRALLEMNGKREPWLITGVAELLEEGKSDQWPQTSIAEMELLNAKAASQ